MSIWWPLLSTNNVAQIGLLLSWSGKASRRLSKPQKPDRRKPGSFCIAILLPLKHLSSNTAQKSFRRSLIGSYPHYSPTKGSILWSFGLYSLVDDVLLMYFAMELLNEALRSPNHKKCFSFAVKCPQDLHKSPAILVQLGWNWAEWPNMNGKVQVHCSVSILEQN